MHINKSGHCDIKSHLDRIDISFFLILKSKFIWNGRVPMKDEWIKAELPEENPALTSQTILYMDLCLTSPFCPEMITIM